MASAPPPRDYVDASADRHGVPREILQSMRRAESGGRTNAVSRKGARGEFQVTAATARSLGYTPEEMHDPEKGAEAGARYVRQMYERFGSWDDAVAAYNAGPSRVAYRKKMGIPLPGETRAYARRIKGEQAAAALEKPAAGGSP